MRDFISHTNSVKEDVITVFVDAVIFSKEAIFKCLYWFGDKFHVNVSLADSQTYLILLKSLNKVSIKKEELDKYLQKLERDLVDYQLRDIITKETQNVRDLLVAKAFSNGDFDEQPPGDVLDPVGFIQGNQHEE